jgi:hypothetical protein
LDILLQLAIHSTTATNQHYILGLGNLGNPGAFWLGGGNISNNGKIKLLKSACLISLLVINNIWNQKHIQGEHIEHEMEMMPKISVCYLSH